MSDDTMELVRIPKTRRAKTRHKHRGRKSAAQIAVQRFASFVQQHWRNLNNGKRARFQELMAQAVKLEKGARLCHGDPVKVQLEQTLEFVEERKLLPERPARG